MRVIVISYYFSASHVVLKNEAQCGTRQEFMLTKSHNDFRIYAYIYIYTYKYMCKVYKLYDLGHYNGK